jgi:oxaloacetate decarboxylase gamma subunit
MWMTPLLAAGIELMLIGMGTVFFFLMLLVFATGLMSRAVGHFAPSTAPADTPPLPAEEKAEEDVAAISAAIQNKQNK